MYSFSVWTSGILYNENVGVYQCQPFPFYLNLLSVVTALDTGLTLILPTMIIFIVNSAISCKLFHYRNQRRDMEAHQIPLQWTPAFSHTSSRSENCECQPESVMSTGQTCGSYRQVSGRYACRSESLVASHLGTIGSRLHETRRVSVGTPIRSQQLRTTRALLVISSIFLLLNLPSHVLRLYTFFYLAKCPECELNTAIITWQEFAQLLYYVNFAANFFLFSACNGNFREAFCNVMKGLRCKPRLRRRATGRPTDFRV